MEQVSINIQQAGTLHDLLDNTSMESIQHLKLSGYLNGDDTVVILKMTKDYNLSVLDLSDVQIVAGGAVYAHAVSEYDEEYESPQENNEICDGMFLDCTKLSRIILPESIKSIGRQAFKGCVRLRSIKLPKTVEYIEDEAFDDCKELTTLDFPDWADHINGDDSYCFKNTGIERLSFPLTFSANNFYLSDMHFLTNIVFREVGDGNGQTMHISNCPSLTYIKVEEVFNCGYELHIERCPSLKHIIYENCVVYYQWDEAMKKNIKTRIVAENDGEITYRWNNGEPSIDITAKSDLIYNYLSYGHWTYITRIDFLYQTAENFSESKKLQYITLGNGFIEIKDGTFENCFQLTSISVYSKLEKIGSFSFYNCTNLVEIEIPSSVYSIGTQAFMGCSKLTNITIPNHVDFIYADTFCNCSNLETIVIGENVRSIGRKAFANCKKLTKIYCKGLVPPRMDKTTFEGVDTTKCKLYVHCLEAYKDSEEWSVFLKKNEEVKEREEIPIIKEMPTNNSMFDTFFNRCKEDFICQKGRVQYDDLYDKVRNSSKLGELCRMSVQGGIAPNAEDFKIAAMIGNTWFGFNQTLIRMGALIALKIWHESINIRYHMINDITLYNKAQSIIRLIS